MQYIFALLLLIRKNLFFTFYSTSKTTCIYLWGLVAYEWYRIYLIIQMFIYLQVFVRTVIVFAYSSNIYNSVTVLSSYELVVKTVKPNLKNAQRYHIIWIIYNIIWIIYTWSWVLYVKRLIIQQIHNFSQFLLLIYMKI